MDDDIFGGTVTFAGGRFVLEIDGMDTTIYNDAALAELAFKNVAMARLADGFEAAVLSHVNY